MDQVHTTIILDELQFIFKGGDLMNIEMNNLKRSRLDWIDAARAFAIFCIVLGHALNGYSFIWKLVYGFHVPLFVLISGFTYTPRPRKENLKKSICGGFRRILVPYFIFGILSIVIYMLIGTKMDGDKAITIAQSIKGLFWANGETGIMRWNLPLWYLPMLFVLRIIICYVLSEKDTPSKLILKFLTFSAFAMIMYYSGFITNLPFCFETVVYLIPFFIFGSFLKQIIHNIAKLKKSLLYSICTGIIIISTFIIAYQKNIDYVHDQYRVYLLFLISALGISSSIIALFSKFSPPKFIIKIGKNTLPILLMHKFPLMFFEYICPGTSNLYSAYRGMASFLISFVAILLCIIATYLVEKIAPWIIGKDKKVC